MDRLTARGNNGTPYYPKCFEEPCLCGGNKEDCNCCELEAAICDRLAAYEDTGLSPDEVALYVKCQAQSVSRRELRLGIEVAQLQAQLANEPLTLDELRGMDGEPVYMVYAQPDNLNGWMLSWDAADYVDEVRRLGATAYRRKPEGSENDATTI